MPDCDEAARIRAREVRTGAIIRAVNERYLRDGR